MKIGLFICGRLFSRVSVNGASKAKLALACGLRFEYTERLLLRKCQWSFSVCGFVCCCCYFVLFGGGGGCFVFVVCFLRGGSLFFVVGFFV